ncbi:MAG: carboxypeptidase regulatory-like domain-containing protein, partial [Anaerolineae bacterium]
MNLKKVLYLLFTIALLLSLWASPASAGAQPSASALTATAASPLARPVQQGLDVGYAPQALSRTLALGTVITDVAGLSLTNDGGAELEWELYEYPEETIPVGGVPLDTGHLTDAFGYTYHDSNEPAGPRFEWIDASDGTGLGLSDDAEANVNLPFAFHFYGSPSTALRVGNNGGLLFGTTSGELAYANTSLDAAGVDDLLVPFWDDLDDETGNVYYKTVGTAPYRRFVVEWYDRPHYNYGGGVGDATTEMILYETTNNIKFQYQDVVFGNADWDGGASVTVGIRSDAANYLQYSYNQAILDAGLAICFQYPGSPPCDGGRFVSWVQQTPVSGTLPAAGTQPVDVGWHADAPEVDSPGVYRATLQISSNDPVDPVIDIPMVMTVTAPANWTQLKGIVSSDRPGGPLVGAHVEIVSNTTQITVCDVSTEEDGGYECWLPWGLYDVSVSAAGYLPNEQSVNATGATYQHDVELQLDAPSVGVSPLSISDVQYGGEVTTHLLTISNGGPGDLNFELREIPGSSPEGTGAIDAGPPDIISTRRVEGDFRVDAEVSTELETGGRADFFIWLRERADLSPAYDIADADTRHEFVFEALTRTADTTQAEIRAYLEGRGLEYEVFWINNSILVRGGDLAVVEAMRARGDVYRIRGVYTRMSIPDPEQLAIVTPTGGQTEADTLWNIDIVSAPQVWSQLGITGDGAVVANIDTGVRYTHEALVDSYRGNLGGGTYDHNYNWGSIYGNGPTACTGSPEAPCDWNGHGSHTMGT